MAPTKAAVQTHCAFHLASLSTSSTVVHYATVTCMDAFVGKVTGGLKAGQICIPARVAMMTTRNRLRQSRPTTKKVFRLVIRFKELIERNQLHP